MPPGRSGTCRDGTPGPHCRVVCAARKDTPPSAQPVVWILSPRSSMFRTGLSSRGQDAKHLAFVLSILIRLTGTDCDELL
jgi:hypothetical protein